MPTEYSIQENLNPYLIKPQTKSKKSSIQNTGFWFYIWADLKKESGLSNVGISYWSIKTEFISELNQPKAEFNQKNLPGLLSLDQSIRNGRKISYI